MEIVMNFNFKRKKDMDEKRAITLTLEKAKKWYNSGNPELKELAATTYSLEELGVVEPWENIKTYEDAYKKVVGDCQPSWIDSGIFDGLTTDINLTRHLSAIFKIDVILKALNGKDYKPCLETGKYFYPSVNVLLKDSEIAKSLERWPSTEYLGQATLTDGTTTLYFTGNCYYDFCGGLLEYHKFPDFSWGTIPTSEMLHCKSEKIAKHMSKYFAKEIFNAVYSQFGYFIQNDLVK
jgi:hypothetical protein